MNTETFLENFHTIANAPGGIARLREMILQLAVQGKLVEQNPDDEPASELLKKIEAEKEKLALEGKKAKYLSNVSDEEKKYQLPSGWEWSKFGKVIELKHGHQFRDYDFVKQGIPVIKISQCRPDGTLDLSNCDYVDKSRIKEFEDFRIYKDDLLMALTGGTLGKVTRVKNDYGIIFQNYRVGKFIPEELVCSKDYLTVIIKSNLFQNLVKSKVNQNAQPNIGKENIDNLSIPLPPLSEQKRIVEKVDSLMALCDRLESLQKKKEELNSLTRKTAFSALGNANEPSELKTAWARVEENTQYLLDSEEAVEEMKKTILQNAIKGNLVPQDPNDEPASELLKKIEDKRKFLIKEKKTSLNLKSAPILENEKSFFLPKGWSWQRFQDITICRDGQRIPVSKSERELRRGIYDYYGASGIIDKIDNYIYDETLLLIGEDGANLINRSTPIAFLATGKYWVNNHAHVIDSLNIDILQYLSIYINAINLEKYITGMAQPKMNQAKMNSIVVSLPPLSEQKRIAEKVDSLFAICDRLQKQLADAKATAANLAKAAVESLTGIV